jgi:hypothetical protein
MPHHAENRRKVILQASLGALLVLCVNPVNASDFTYDAYAATLKAFVDGDGLVDYRGLKAQPKDLEDFVASVGRVREAEYGNWGERQQVAFWINAYNALTLKVIVDNYPIKAGVLTSVLYPGSSIRQIPGVWDKITFRVLGKPVILDGIEHDTLRARFNEPRIHMALVCAAMGCPPLRTEPYVPERLDAQLDDQTARFLRNPRSFRIDRDGGAVFLSSIFKWFGTDFVKNYGTSEKFVGKDDAERAVLNFVSRSVDASARVYLETARYSISYLPYDWSLNERGAQDGR